MIIVKFKSKLWLQQMWTISFYVVSIKQHVTSSISKEHLSNYIMLIDLV